MDKDIPRFVRHAGPWSHVTFVTINNDGKKVEMPLWDLINRYGADEVLRMREKYPEIAEGEET
jgi:hypothetical protein